MIVVLFVFVVVDASSNGRWDRAQTGCGAAPNTCHKAEDPTITVGISGLPAQYTPLQTYTLTITSVGGPAGNIGGFNLQVTLGTLSTTDPNAETNGPTNDQARHSNPNSRTWTVDWTAPAGGSGTVTFYLAAMSADGLNGNDGDSWKLYSTTVDELVVANNPPEAQDPIVEGFSTGTQGILHIIPPGPTLGWTFSDPDGGDVQVQYQVRVGTGSGSNDMWNPTAQTSGASSVVYGGSTLSDNTDYWFGVRVNDGTDWSVWNETMFHMNSVDAQDLTVQNFPDLSAGIMHITDHTPSLNWTFWDGEADSQTQYQVRVGTAPGLSNMWGPGIIPGATTSEIYAGTALVDGTDYWFGVRVHDGYEWSVWAEVMFHMNSVEVQDPQVQGFSDPSPGILHITDHNPILSWTFFDNEADSQLDYEIRVGTAPGLSDMWNPGAQAGGATSDVYAGSPLVDNTDYWYAIRVYDGYEWSPWNEVMFHMNNLSEAIDLTVDSFADGSAGIMHITVANPDLGWTFFDLEIGDSQQQYQVRVGTSSGASDMWAPPAQFGPTTSVTYAGLLLVDGTDYWFGVRVYDGYEWSEWNETMFHTNTKPETHTLTVSGYINGSAGNMHIIDHTPDLGWTFLDNEIGDVQTQYEIRVGTAPGLSDMWNPGVTSGGASSEVYSGLALTDGNDYYFEIRVYDGYEWSIWNSTIFHMNTPPPAPVFPISPPDDSNIPSSPAQTLDWTPGGGDSEGDTIEYYWVVDTDMPPILPFLDSGVTTSTSSNPFPTNPATDYYWIVNATDGWEWTTGVIWNFTTSAIVNNPPEAIDLLVSGFADATAGIMHIIDHTPLFEWSFTDPDGGDTQQRYQVRVGTAAGLSDMWAPGEQMSGAKSETYAGSVLLDGTDYWFAVRVYDGNTWSVWNETQFHVNSVEAQDPRVSGFFEFTSGIMHIIDHTPDLAWLFWDGEADSQTQYEIQVGTQSGFSDMWAFGPSGGPQTSEVYGGASLIDGTDYYFQIRVNDSYEWSQWTEVMFHMNALPPAPIPPLSPPDDAIIPSSPAQTLSWSSGGADPDGDTKTYWWYIDTDPIPTAPYLAEGTTVGLSSTAFATSPATDYYWYVNATDGWEWNPTIIWNFTTSSVVNNPPEALDLTVSGFLNGSVEIMHIIDHTPDFTWSFFDLDGGDVQMEFEIRVGTQSGFSDMWTFGPQSGAATTETYAGAPLLDGTDYYFGIRLYDGATWSVWNETLFHMNALPPLPTPLNPLDDSLIPSSPFQTLSWTPGGSDPEGDTITYYWYVDTDNPPLIPYLDNGTTTGTSSTSFATAPASEYYWIINVTDGYEWISTIVWNFSTSGTPNVPPEAIDLLVSGSADGTQGILHITDATPDLGWTFSDSDGGDFQQQYEIRVGTAAGLSDMWNPGAQAGGATSEVYAGSALLDGTDYWFGVRVFDGLAWSAWNETMFHMNTPPQGLVVSVSGFLPGTQDIMHLLDHTPILAWSFSDSEGGDIQIEYEIRVGTASGLSDMWAPGAQPGTQTIVTYSGSTLFDGIDYWFGIRVFDGYEWSQWNETQFRMNTPPPGASTPLIPSDDSNITESASQTVSWTAGGSDPEGDTITYYWFVDTDAIPTAPYLANNFTTGLTSTAFITMVSSEYYWFVNATDGWEWTVSVVWNFSTKGPVNSVPEAVDLQVEGFSEGSQDILHLLEHTPEFTWTFSDSDSGDDQVMYEIKVGTTQGSSNLWNPGVVNGDHDTITYAGSALADGVDFWVSVRVSDGQNWSEWSEVLFHMNIPPEVTGMTVDGFGEGTTGIMEISGETPLLDATIVDSDGLFTQNKYELRIGSASGLSDIWAPGIVDGTFSELEYDGPALEEGTSYWFGLRVFDGYEWGGWDEIEFKTNSAPTLDWIGGSGYTMDGLEPEDGNLSTIFVFKVEYTDHQGHQPKSGHPVVHILKWGLEIAGSPFAMSYESGTNLTGAIYFYSTVLSEGTNYSYYFSASDILGKEAIQTDEKDGPNVVEVTVEIPIEPPGNVKAVATDDPGELRITWDRSTSDDVSGYNIYRSSTSDTSGFVLIDSTGPFATSYTDSGLEDETTYYYMIKAFDSYGNESDYSTQVQATTISEPEEGEPEQNLCWLYTLIIFIIIIVVIILLIRRREDGGRIKEEERLSDEEIYGPSGKEEASEDIMDSEAGDTRDEVDLEGEEVEKTEDKEVQAPEEETIKEEVTEKEE